MSPAAETLSAATAAGLSGLVGAYVGDHLFTTIIPTLIGTGVHLHNRLEAKKLTRSELLYAAIIAFMVGFTGGPWFADEFTSSEKALPFMCFLFSMWATTLLTLTHEWAKRKLGGRNGGV